MLVLSFYLLPLIAVTFGGPIWLAVKKQRGIVFFTSQAMTMLGLLFGIGAVNSRAFGQVGFGAGSFILTMFALAGFSIAFAWYHFKR